MLVFPCVSVSCNPTMVSPYMLMYRRQLIAMRHARHITEVFVQLTIKLAMLFEDQCQTMRFRVILSPLVMLEGVLAPFV